MLVFCLFFLESSPEIWSRLGSRASVRFSWSDRKLSGQSKRTFGYTNCWMRKYYKKKYD